MVLVFIVTFCIIIALGFGAAAAWSDFNSLKIPNIYSILIGGAFVPTFVLAAFFAPDISFFGSWKNHLLSGGVMFAITFALFYFKKIGGGDAKLISVFSLWAGMSAIMPLLFMMTITGGLLGGITLYLNKSKSTKPLKSALAKSQWIVGSKKGARDVPYGIAIFIGAIFSFWHAGYIQPVELMDLATHSMGGQ